MIITCSQMYRTARYSQHNSIVWTVWLQTKWLWVRIPLMSLRSFLHLPSHLISLTLRKSLKIFANEIIFSLYNVAFQYTTSFCFSSSERFLYHSRLGCRLFSFCSLERLLYPSRFFFVAFLCYLDNI